MSRLLSIVFLIGCVVAGTVDAAKANRADFYRNFWLPTFHGQRLAYCTMDGKACGAKVANRYCQIMGYGRADQQVIGYNVGLTNYLDNQAKCQGWRCNGFNNIRCVGKFTDKPPKPYHYRLRRYVFPRFGSYRMAYCYDGQRGCGRRAAYSFCRRMGYLDARRYEREAGIAATKAIGNQRLCFGKECTAFSYVTCFR